ncbi:hypothetical protein RJT34_16923 [Clitoria ternatea]|uniref:Uncharacterized protein n=1 Tax=Clitoria ternatea TaxID=43366 RepID=A0AAN9J810_CLITE
MSHNSLMCDFDDNWVDKAMADDTIVADFLLRLREPSSFNLHWTVRQRRTRRRRITEPSRASRASPTTPLSWTAATSIDGYEGSIRSSRPVHGSGSDKAVLVDKAPFSASTSATIEQQEADSNLQDHQFVLPDLNQPAHEN